MRRILLPLLSAAFLVFSLPAGLQAKDNYKKILKQHTRSDEVYWSQNLHAAIIWHATRLSDPMLDAMAGRNAEIYGYSGQDQQRVLSEIRRRQAGDTWFFVSFYGGDKHFNDLLDPRAGWELRLKAGGRTYEPAKIEKNKRTTPLDTAYFPYLNPWATGYYVWFPAQASGRFPMTLEIHGPQARSGLKWE